MDIKIYKKNNTTLPSFLRENGEWSKLPQHERVQQENYLQHIGTIAQFDNILGKKTIQTIKMLTSQIKSIFCHPTMVDRIASMLNYLLLQLVGPNKKNLKVLDIKILEFMRNTSFIVMILYCIKLISVKGQRSKGICIRPSEFGLRYM